MHLLFLYNILLQLLKVQSLHASFIFALKICQYREDVEENFCLFREKETSHFSSFLEFPYNTQYNEYNA